MADFNIVVDEDLEENCWRWSTQDFNYMKNKKMVRRKITVLFVSKDIYARIAVNDMPVELVEQVDKVNKNGVEDEKCDR